jgi:deoxyribodipyrimidine photolyase-related protein
MPKYAEANFFAAKRKLPKLYWDGQTEMKCLHEVVMQTMQHAYSHHIQRLMITGNFALLAGLDPMEVCEWYLMVYADAFDWVELPNTLGMALYGDGGVLASKPYAASGKYINRMSNFCKGCRYNPDETVGETACPFNSLYWRFIHIHEAKLRTNQRFYYMYSNWHKMPEQKKTEILQQAENFLSKLV